MQCEQCHQNPATVHLAHIENGEKIEQHLCEICAKKMQSFSMGDGISFQDFFAGLMDIAMGSPSQQKSTTNKPQGISDLQCPVCHMTYNEFRKTGKIGCASCYEVFEQYLYPIIKRIHGNTEHTGKLPQKAASDLKLQRKIQELQKELQAAIEEEAYEKAAQLRDQIRELEKEGE
ncbi:MAG: hypothetical protein GX962_03325 [Epulopiscium sp.]|nr:hypothetical protein [Candidatus Epulonipiscium sp.]